MMNDLTTLRQKTNRQVAALDAARIRCQAEQKALDAAQARVDAAQEAQGLAQQIAAQVQQKAHDRIAGVVTRSLQAVFDDPYEFVIRFEQKRGRTEARMVFIRDGQEIDPLTASGGGVVDVAAFALRLSCLMLARPPLRRLLVLDEPFRFVSANLHSRVRGLLEALSQELGVQIIMVTHEEALTTGTVVELE
jgi:DNA repair exonuclease SbcCD ATPase subunit